MEPIYIKSCALIKLLKISLFAPKKNLIFLTENEIMREIEFLQGRLSIPNSPSGSNVRE